jgi:hypothetical protein
MAVLAKETAMHNEEDDEDEIERCRDCGQTPDEGVCFYCKMD